MLKNFLDAIKSLLWTRTDQRKKLDMASNANFGLKSVVWIRRAENERRMQARFVYQLRMKNDSVKEREFHLNRLVAEPNSEALSRLQCNIIKHTINANNKKKKEKSAAAIEAAEGASVNISLYDGNGAEIDGALPNSQAWVDGGILQIGDIRYSIQINSPEILKVLLPSVILCGFPLLPSLTLEFAQSADCDCQWIRVGTSDITVGHDFLYTPVLEDIGHTLKLIVTPKRGNYQGEPVEILSTAAVVEAPDLLAVKSRTNFTSKDLLGRGFRVVSYNLLADTYADSDFSRDKLFAHCDGKFLNYDYRKALIAKELLEYNADVICLQEVDSKHFEHYYQPLFTIYGYGSSMFSKRHYKIPEDWHSPESDMTTELDGDEEQETAELVTCEDADLITSVEGSAIMFKKSKFRQISDHSLSISQTLENDPKYSDLKEAALSSKLATEKLLYRSGCPVQVVVLAPVDDPTKRLCVATTHLYFHPLASAVRLLQIAVAIRHLQHVKSTYEEQGYTTSVLLCGDFNSSPTSHVVQLIRNRQINAKDKVWIENQLYAMEGINLRHHLNMDSACGYPKYTNYVPAFKECIDYIFYEKENLFVESVIQLPSDDFMVAHGDGIPSENFPSDHLALCCQLSWK